MTPTFIPSLYMKASQTNAQKTRMHTTENKWKFYLADVVIDVTVDHILDSHSLN